MKIAEAFIRIAPTLPEIAIDALVARAKPGESRENMIKNLERVRERLGKGGASERTAEIAMQMLSRT